MTKPPASPCAGIDQVAFSEVEHDHQGSGRRAEARLAVGAHGMLITRAGPTLCTILDLCAAGAKLHVPQGLVPVVGEVVKLALVVSGDHDAQVVWVGRQTLGLRFLTAIADPAEELGSEALGADYPRRLLAMQQRLRRGSGS